MDFVACLKASALIGGREQLIVTAACAVLIAYLGFSIQHKLAQLITVSVLLAFVAFLVLGSVYVECLKPLL